MTEAQLRRIELLENTRNTYKNYSQPPAIHPRYQSVYKGLYEEKDSSTKNSSSIRLAIALFLFVVYAMLSYKDYSFGIYNTNTVVETISTNIEVENVWNSW